MPNNHDQDDPVLIPRREVERLTSLSCTSIYRLMDVGLFPRPVRISERRVAWVKSLVTNWTKARIAEQTDECDGRRRTPPAEATKIRTAARLGETAET